eukprot:4954093-Pyramimonas_sp.AAC.1
MSIVGPPLVHVELFQVRCPSQGSHPVFYQGKYWVSELGCRSLVYNNSGIRLKLPQAILKNRVLAAVFLTIYVELALSRGTVSQ